MNMKTTSLALVLLTASFLIPPGSALPTAAEIVWTGGTAYTETGTSHIIIPDADTDGEKVGFVYYSAVTSSNGCRFVYGDVNGWTKTMVNSTANACISVKFITGDTWVTLFTLLNGTAYTAWSTDNGASWSTRNSLTGPSIGNPIAGSINGYRFFAHSLTTLSLLPSSGTSSGLYLTTDGGMNWANVIGGNCGASNGFNGAIDIEYPISFTGSSLSYAYPAGGLITLDTTTSTCGAGQALTFPLPGFQLSPGPAVTSVGTLFWSGSGSPCGGPIDSVYNTQCRIIVSNRTSGVTSYSLKGGVGVMQVPINGGAGGEILFYDSTTSVTSNITSLVPSAVNNACGLTMAGSNVYCIFNAGAGQLNTAKFITTAISTTTTQEPEDFGTGLAAFMAGLGFITPESQFFFALILVGLTTVTLAILLKFMGSGRSKMITIASTAMIVGVFCVVLSLFDLWMYTLGLVLGIFIVRGSKDLRNTVLEVQQALRERLGKGGGEGEPDEVAGIVQQESGPMTRVTEEEVDDIPEYDGSNEDVWTKVNDEPQSTGPSEPSSEP